LETGRPGRYDQGTMASRIGVLGWVTGVVSAGERFEADCVLLAAGAWSAPLAASLGLHLPVVPVRGQMLDSNSGIVHEVVFLPRHCV